MLDFISARYQHAMELSHIELIKTFRKLPLPAQCLFVRMAGRKGQIFDAQAFRYTEIPDILDQVKILSGGGFIGAVQAENYVDFLAHLTKADLLVFCRRRAGQDQFKTSWKKSVLIDTALRLIPYKAKQIDPRYIVQLRQPDLDYLLFLYFGKIVPNMQPFTLRDLGLIRPPDFKDNYDARFNTMAQARAAYFYARKSVSIETLDRISLGQLADDIDNWPEPQCDASSILRDKVIYTIGRSLERGGDTAKAASVYANAQSPKCRERLIRLRYSEGQKSWAKERLEDMIDNPGSDDEYYFAADFYTRKFKQKRTGTFTDILRQGEIIEVDELYKNSPETAAKLHFSRDNYTGYFTENNTWRMLFGLLFWQDLFNTQASALHSSFDRTPLSLKSNQFYNHHKNTIELRLSEFYSKDSFLRYLLKTYTQNYGKPNALFRWNKNELNKIQRLIQTSQPESLAAMLRLMAQNYMNMKDGFPDLMLVKNNQIKFVEVKSDGDVIRRNQLTRIMQLQKAGFVCGIARIKWRVDPGQTYVVVDVETTGGRNGHHRITEVGAVKIRGDEIIDEWQSLINPQRHIPKHIQVLTGITNEMVSDVPVFADIAEDLADFMGDDIFAAHNVNFDYGFISREYRRLDQKFTAPKICTCASMRKYYPGLKSYSLKNLCREFDIDLTSHHRALCDARAAAALLIKVNSKRLAAQEKNGCGPAIEKSAPYYE